MENQELIELMKFKFKTDIEKVFVKYKNRVQIQIRKDLILKLAEWLFRSQGLRFIIATASDLGEKYEIVYHFSYDPTGLIINVQTFIPKEKPQVDSLVPLTTAADWIEREMHELFGIEFRNHPHLVPLLSEGNWKKEDYPFKKKPK